MERLLNRIAAGIRDKVSHEINKLGKIRHETKALDLAAEKVALDIIKESGQKLNVLSEESGFLDFRGKRTLVLDPIDGTFNALLGVPIYATSIAIGTNKLSDMECGLVKNLVSNENFYAELGKGAFLDNRKITTSKFDKRNSIFSVYLGRHAEESSYRVARLARRVRSLSCASLELCLVAKGSLDLYYQVGYPLRITDLAAGTLILREAGGEVYDEKGKVLDLDIDLKKKANVVAVGDKYSQILSFIGVGI